MNEWDLSETNLRKTYDYCNRRGVQIDNSLGVKDICDIKTFYHSINLYANSFKWNKVLKVISKIRTINSHIQKDDEKEKHNLIIDEVENTILNTKENSKKKKAIRILKRVVVSIKDSLVKDVFLDYCRQTNANNKRWKIKKTNSSNASYKDVYTLYNGLDYLYCRIIQESIKHKYGIRIGNRQYIIKQLKCVLDDKLPKAIIRTDIKSFFENIDSDELINELEKEKKLQKTHINAIKSIISEYHKISSQTKGVPRGIGISSYLAEKCLVGIDEKVRNSENVLFYSRFVDDIVIITTETDDNSTTNAKLVFNALKKDIEAIHLELHPEGGKTSICSFESMDFNYLGYHFLRDKDHLIVDIATNKIEKIKTRIDFTFISFFNRKYCLNNGITYKKKLKILRERLELLSYQVHLLGMSKKVTIGTPITYSEVTRDNSFDDLNKELQLRLANVSDINVHKVLAGVSFQNKNNCPTKNISYSNYKYLTTIWKGK